MKLYQLNSFGKLFWHLKFFTTNYGNGNVEHITDKHSNPNWRWRDITSVSNVVTKCLFQQVGTGERISLRSKIWWQNVGSLLQGIKTVANLKSEINKDWNGQLVKAIYNNVEYKHIMTTLTS